MRFDFHLVITVYVSEKHSIFSIPPLFLLPVPSSNPILSISALSILSWLAYFMRDCKQLVLHTE